MVSENVSAEGTSGLSLVPASASDGEGERENAHGEGVEVSGTYVCRKMGRARASQQTNTES